MPRVFSFLLWLLVVQSASGVHAPFREAASIGNVTALVDESDGTYSARYEYGPFGEPVRGHGDLEKANPFRFSNKFTDNETGLVYYGHRYYNPDTGRWLNRDPIGEEGGLNLYAMVGNDPVNMIDPWGLETYVYDDIQDPNSFANLRAEFLGGPRPGRIFKQTRCELWEEGKDLAYEVAKEALLAYTGEKLAAAAFGVGLKGLKALGAARAARAAGLIDDAAEASLQRDPRKIAQGRWSAIIDDYGDTAMNHIKQGHFFNSRPGARSSRFSESNSSISRVKNLVTEAIAKGNHMTNSRGDYSIIHTFDDIIGTDISGRKTKTIQIFLDMLGNVKNAYPIR